MTLTRCAIPDEISKLEFTAFARLSLVSIFVSKIDVGSIPRQIRYQRDQECYSRAPIDTVFVAVSSMSSIKSWDIDVPMFDQPVVGSHDSRDWT